MCICVFSIVVIIIKCKMLFGLRLFLNIAGVFFFFAECPIECFVAAILDW